MSGPEGFARAARSGVVAITHGGRPAPTLRGDRAAFQQELDGMDDAAQQEAIARLTGNDRRGDERQARRHPRDA